MAADSFADWRDRSRLGIAIVAIMRIIATTIKSSNNENPLFLGFICVSLDSLAVSAIAHPAAFRPGVTAIRSPFFIPCLLRGHVRQKPIFSGVKSRQDTL